MGLVGEGDHVGGQKCGQGQAEQERLGDGQWPCAGTMFTLYS